MLLKGNEVIAKIVDAWTQSPSRLSQQTPILVSICIHGERQTSDAKSEAEAPKSPDDNLKSPTCPKARWPHHSMTQSPDFADCLDAKPGVD
jgi:hypothetical protein